MTPGTNYDIHEYSAWFWVAFLTVAVFVTLGLMCLFIYEVYRTSQAALPEGVEPPRLPTLKPSVQSPAPAAELHTSGRAPAA